MDPKIAESIGLLKHQIISPVLMETTAAQMEYFRQIAQKDFEVPGRGARRFSPTVMKSWFHKYRKNGFSGITPKTGIDLLGRDTETKEVIICMNKENRIRGPKTIQG